MKLAKLKKGEALVLRTCKTGMTSHSGFTWPKKGKVSCPDWKPTQKCGNGLHGLMWGVGDGTLLNWSEDAVWILVRVKELACVDLDGKVKFEKGHVVYSGPRDGAIEIILGLRPGIPDLTCGIYGSIKKNAHSETSGTCGAATASGDCGAATASGYNGAATASGHRGAATASGDRGAAYVGFDGKVAAGKDGSICAKWWDGKRHRLAIGYTGEDGIKPFFWYRLNDKHKFIESGPVEKELLPKKKQ